MTTNARIQRRDAAPWTIGGPSGLRTGSEPTSGGEPVADEAQDAEPLAARMVRGGLGGLGSGAVFALVTIWFTTQLGEAADQPLLMISTIATGSDTAGAGTNAALGVMVHLALSGLFGLAFAGLAPRLATNGTLVLAGGAFGLAVYTLNFRIISPFVFPAFQEASQPFEVLIHLLYGLLVALPFLSTGVRQGEPRFALV